MFQKTFVSIQKKYIYISKKQISETKVHKQKETMTNGLLYLLFVSI